MLVARPLTPDEARTLQAELRTTPNILGYTVKELLLFREVFVAEVDGALAGVCLSKDLRFGWTDIAVLYVLPAFRGQRLGTHLYAAACQRAQERERHIVTLSRNPAVIGLMAGFGMEIGTSLRTAPLALHLYMNRHMMSLYRLREGFRKSRDMRNAPPLLCGAKRYRPPGAEN